MPTPGRPRRTVCIVPSLVRAFRRFFSVQRDTPKNPRTKPPLHREAMPTSWAVDEGAVTRGEKTTVPHLAQMPMHREPVPKAKMYCLTKTGAVNSSGCFKAGADGGPRVKSEDDGKERAGSQMQSAWRGMGHPAQTSMQPETMPTPRPSRETCLAARQMEPLQPAWKPMHREAMPTRPLQPRRSPPRRHRPRSLRPVVRQRPVDRPHHPAFHQLERRGQLVPRPG